MTDKFICPKCRKIDFYENGESKITVFYGLCDSCYPHECNSNIEESVEPFI